MFISRWVDGKKIYLPSPTWFRIEFFQNGNNPLQRRRSAMRWPSKSCVFLGMCLMVSGASMRAQTGKVVKAVAQTSNYPVVELVVNVRDGATGQGVYGLNKSTFAVIENNELQEINNFVVKARGKVEPID